MKEVTAYYGDSDIAKNCHGFWTMRYGVDVMGHNGNSYGGSTSFFFDPKTGLGIAVFTNVQQESTFCYGLAPIVFGECRMEEAPKKSEDISGIYLLSRFYTKGRFELLKYVGGLLRIPSCDENGVYPLGGPKDRIVPCGEHQYILQQGDYVRNLLYAQENEDGTKSLQMLSMDLIQEKKSTMIFHFITIGLFAVSVILSIVLAMIRLIRFLIRRIRRKEKMPSSSHRFWMEVQNVIVGGCAILSLIVPLVQGTFCGIGIQIAAVILGLSVITAGVQIGLFIFHLIKTKENKTRIRNTIPVAMCMGYISFFIVYWYLYKFY